ncbi:MAG: ATP-dependent DNA helicase RecG [Clostridiales bacterium]|nr:ATP-dependent DNA helicase RecG [Clostridiales bacterium]
MELAQLHGIGKNRLQALHAAGINSLRDLLYAVPVKYKDTSAVSTVAQALEGERCTFELVREQEAKLSRFGKKSRVTCVLSDDTGALTACWFNQPWMRENLNKVTRIRLYGVVSSHAGKKQLINPSVEKELAILPVYRPIDGLPHRVHEDIVAQALAYVDVLCPETLPEGVIRRHDLCSGAECIRALHRPSSMEEVARAQRRFAFEQMLLYQAAVLGLKELRRRGYAMEIGAADTALFWQNMPFQPTAAQRRTLREIADDLARPAAMVRMVQGDVGCGKTAVALGAMVLCAKAGYQSALMAPTEILARQHYENLRVFCEKQGIGCGLLLGGMPVRERRAALENIASGRWQIVIGTHALIGQQVTYARLGLCITDEQHRFGVAQRTALINKGVSGQGEDICAPHLLVMSATPIPRTLALVMFGDLDISIIDELPPGRKPVTTRIVPEEKRQGMYGFLRKELDEGRQAYIVCPLVEESETTDPLKAAKPYAAKLQAGELKAYRVGLTYGGQPAAEKQETLNAFAAGEIQVLVATTVIEVGVNVPNASMMMIEDADRYGLAQLHQLRGRVGRGDQQSWCFLLSKANERLRALTQTNDGFEIARKDLELRGPGELLGTRQHGEALLPGGAVAFGSMELLYEAAGCAQELQAKPELDEEWQIVSRAAEKHMTVLDRSISIS